MFYFTLLIIVMSLSALDCGDHEEYKPNMTACEASCQQIDAPAVCQHPTVEGCECVTGYVRSGDICVQEDSCGCTDANNYYYPVCIFQHNLLLSCQLSVNW